MVLYILLGVALLALLAAFLLYKLITSQALAYGSLLYRLKAWLILTFGQFRRIKCMPWFKSYGYDQHNITLKDIRCGSAVARPGDVGLHMDDGFASNLVIPGAFKHAWVFVDGNDCVEAVAEGVLRRDDMVPLQSDYAVILRPIGTTKTDVDKAVARAKMLVGYEYDANFKFDIEEAESSMGLPKDRAMLNLKGFHPAFSCTETVGVSWWHCKDKLAIFRSVHAGREAIIADDFLRMGFGIVWMSPGVTELWAKEGGMHEDARKKIKDFVEGKRDFNDHGNPIPRRR